MKKGERIEKLIAIQSEQVERLREAVACGGEPDLKKEEARAKAVARLEELLLSAHKLEPGDLAQERPGIVVIYDYGDAYGQAQRSV